MICTRVSNPNCVLSCRSSAGTRSSVNVTCHQRQSSGALQRIPGQQHIPLATLRREALVSGPHRHQLDQSQVVEVEPSHLDTYSVISRGSPAEQQQALLFLAITSGLLATADDAQAADLPFLADLAINKGQVISFLVNNPFITLGVAVALYLIVPRVLRFATRYILLPLTVAGGVYLVITNPSTSWRVVTTGVGYITANPAITSIAILGVLALALSPYVLIIGGIALVFSAASLPGPLKKLLPAPVVEVERQLDVVRQQVKGPTAQAASKLNSLKDGIFGGKTKALAPAHLDASKLLSAPSLISAEEHKQQ